MSLWFGDFELDPERRLLLRAGEPVPLEPKAYELLSLLVQRRPRALSRAQIRDAVWPHTHVSESTLAVVVTGIRQALGDDARRPRFIRTVHGFGYAFSAEALSVAGRPEVPEATRDHGTGSIADAPADVAPDERPGAEAASRAPLAARWPLVVASAAVLVVLSAGGLWFGARRPTLAEGPPKVVPLTSLPGAELHPALSPDGSRVAFIWNGPGRDNFDVYVKEIGSGEMGRVTSDPAPDYHPTWSPDGHHLAFVRRTEEGATLFLVPAAGGQERRLADLAVPDWLYEMEPVAFWLDWSPDGRYLATTDRPPDAGRWGIVLVSAETGEKRVLTSEPDRFPRFSPDGRRLAFLRGGFYVSEKADLLVLALSSGASPHATADGVVVSKDLTVGPIAWLPGGRELIVGAQRVPLDGSAPRPFDLPGRPFRANVESLEDLSIRGARVAFSAPEHRLQLFRVPLGVAGPVTPVPFHPSTRGEESPAITSDGRRFAFTSWRSGDGHVFVGDVAGPGLREIAPPPGTAYACSARWSPDGRRLAFDAAIGGQFHVFVAAPDAGTLRRLTSDHTDDARPRWSRDGLWIYFASTRSGELELWKMQADADEGEGDSAAVRITRDGGMEAEESRDGRYLYYAKRKEPGLFRVPLGAPEAATGERVLDFGGEGRWQLGSHGIYVLDAGAGRAPTIRLADYASGATATVAQVPIGPEWAMHEFGGALVIAPDETWALIGAEGVVESDLFLVEGFR
jgi:Tol biopolymer transport system component/DNA-binding winged helix-turn-helix (wHTH) protein